MNKMESKYIILDRGIPLNYTKKVLDIFDISSKLIKGRTRAEDYLAVYHRNSDSSTIIGVSEKNKETFIILSRPVNEPIEKSEEMIIKTRKVLTSILNKDSLSLH